VEPNDKCKNYVQIPLISKTLLRPRFHLLQQLQVSPEDAVKGETGRNKDLFISGIRTLFCVIKCRIVPFIYGLKLLLPLMRVHLESRFKYQLNAFL
jgi:hypothetical protein